MVVQDGPYVRESKVQRYFEFFLELEANERVMDYREKLYH